MLQKTSQPKEPNWFDRDRFLGRARVRIDTFAESAAPDVLSEHFKVNRNAVISIIEDVLPAEKVGSHG